MSVNYHASTHAPKSFGGTDPLMGLPVALLLGWEAEDDGEIVPNLWTDAAGTGIGFYNDGYVTKGAAVSVDLDPSGEMTFPKKVLVQVNAWAQFIGDFDEGDVVGVSITGTWGRIINAVTCDALGVPGAEKIAVSAAVYHPTTAVSFRVQVFHTNAGNMVLNGAYLSGAFVNELIDSAWQFHA